MTERPDPTPETGTLQLPEPPAAPSQATMKATLQAYVDATNRGDAAGLLSLFAPGAVIEDPVGSPPKSGAALKPWFEATVALRARLTPVAPSRGSYANEAALVFEVAYDAGGRRLKTRSLDVCRFDEQGRITALRAYWGPEDVEDLGPADDAVV
jgi:steroid Delta-isomerase